MNARIVVKVATTRFRSARPKRTTENGISSEAVERGFIVIVVMVCWKMVQRRVVAVNKFWIRSLGISRQGRSCVFGNVEILKQKRLFHPT